GLTIVGGFDVDSSLNGKKIDGKPIYHIDDLKTKLAELGGEIAIVTVPAAHAQEAVDKAVEAGAKGIWNFAPTHVTVPNGIVIENFNFSSSLAVLMHNLKE
ncbi:MAG TPA: redox-sensing transcriptional repressor Rex, partial [Firmicutes bacterium]|nr:redox-sensing transcriptional repressor Rex [Bacillota bacterium]